MTVKLAAIFKILPSKDAAKAVASASRGRLTAKRQTSDESTDGKMRSPLRNAILTRSNNVTSSNVTSNGVCNIEVALQPLQEQQRQLNERMAKMQHTLGECFVRKRRL